MQTLFTKKNTFLLNFVKSVLGLFVVILFFAPFDSLLFTAQAQIVPATTPSTVPPTPATAASAASPTPTPAPTTASVQSCWSSSWDTCLTDYIIYPLTVGITTMFAYIGSIVFNVGLNITLQSVTYSQSFITEGWTAVRDFANMFFIFILVYIAVVVIFSAESANTMRQLAAVIIVALLINFSFFASRLVIDGGNILAVQFYNAINAQPMEVSAQNSTIASAALQLTKEGTKDLTYNIMGLIGVQNLLGSNSFTITAKAGLDSPSKRIIVLTFVYIAVAIILATLGFIFIIVGIKFLVRIAFLWIAIIASPLAFIAGAFSYGRINSGAGKWFKQWRSYLIEYSFFPAVFLFLFWIINNFAIQLGGSTGNILSNALSEANNASGSGYLLTIGQAIGSVVIRLGIVVILLLLALKASNTVATEANGLANAGASWTGNKLSGLTAWGARSTVGRAGYQFAESATGKKLASSNLILGKTLFKGADRIGRAGFDVRGVPGINKSVDKLTGIKLANAPTRSFADTSKKAVDKKTAFASRLKPNERQLEDAYKKALKNINPADEARLQSAYNNYLAVEQDFENNVPGVGQKEVAQAKSKFESVLKSVGKTVSGTAKKAAGSGNPSKYADSLESGWFVSREDKLAAAKIRGNSEKDGNARLKELVEKNSTPQRFNIGGGGGQGGGGNNPGGGGGNTGGGPAGGGGNAGGGNNPGTTPQGPANISAPTPQPPLGPQDGGQTQGQPLPPGYINPRGFIYSNNAAPSNVRPATPPPRPSAGGGLGAPGMGGTGTQRGPTPSIVLAPEGLRGSDSSGRSTPSIDLTPLNNISKKVEDLRADLSKQSATTATANTKAFDLIAKNLQEQRVSAKESDSKKLDALSEIRKAVKDSRESIKTPHTTDTGALNDTLHRIGQALEASSLNIVPLPPNQKINTPQAPLPITQATTPLTPPPTPHIPPKPPSPPTNLPKFNGPNNPIPPPAEK